MKKWYSTIELAGLNLPGVPTTRSGVLRAAKRRGWNDQKHVPGRKLVRRRKGRGGGVEYHYSLLPYEAQVELQRRSGETGAPAATTSLFGRLRAMLRRAFGPGEHR